MARYIDPKCRLCRREGIKLYLKGERCTQKCPIDRKGAVPPGAHKFKRRKTSSYGFQLREKQKLKSIYFILERQLKNYFIKALSTHGDSGENLLRLLEQRLDNIVYRSGLVSSRMQARQLISHGHVCVDGKKASIASYHVKPDQVINIDEPGLKINYVKDLLGKKQTIPAWLEKKVHVVKVLRVPARDDINSELNDKLIVEYYSR